MIDPELSSFGDFRLGDWLVQPRLNRISRGDSTVTLEPKMMKVLVCLADNTGELVTRQELIDSVWATEFISENILTRAIAELRNALGDDAKDPTFIETIHRSGYRLILPVERLSGEGGEPITQVAAGKRRWPHVLAVGIAAIIGLLLIFPPTALFERGGDESSDPSLPRIVVLPFENFGPPEDEYFADGITEEIISRLAAVSGLQVISRTSAMHYKGMNAPLQQIGKELDVGYVLEGAIRLDRSGEGHGRVRITPQLIKVDDDTHLWSDSYDRVLEDIFAVQSDIAVHVIERLEATVLEPEREMIDERPTANLEAYQAYLRGVRHVRDGVAERPMNLAVEMFERAVALDPDFAVAHARLSEAHSRLYLISDTRTERLAWAKESVSRALEIERDLPEGYRALGWYYYRGFRDYDRALEHFTIASKNLVSDPDLLLGFAAVNKRRGRWDEALEVLRRWRAVDPLDATAVREVAYIHLWRREFEKAEAEITQAIAMAPDRSDLYQYAVPIFLARDGSTVRARRLLASAPSLGAARLIRTALRLERYDRKPEVAIARLEGLADELFNESYPKSLWECVCLSEVGEMERARVACQLAVVELEQAAQASPADHFLMSRLGLALALLGRDEEAIRAGKRAVEMMPVSDDTIYGTQTLRGLARIYARGDRHERALDLIDELISMPSPVSAGTLRLDPAWDLLRDHPRFQALLEEYDTD